MRRIFSAAFFILDYRAARWCCGYFLTANTRTTPPTYAIIWAEWEGHADASIRPHAA
jgi:hypothetical protein